MASANWLPIVSIIVSAMATLAAPVIALFVAARMNQPKLTPQPQKPKNRIQRIGGWLIRLSTSPWILPPIGIVLNICALLYELRRATPVTGQVILAISLSVSSLFFNLALLSILSIRDDIAFLAGLHRRENEFGTGILEISKALHERIKKLEEKPKPKKLPKN